MSFAFDESVIRAAADNLSNVDQLVLETEPSLEERIRLLSELSPFDFSSPGQFYANSIDAYEAELDGLVRRLVEPEPAPLKARVKRSSHLASVLKRTFRKGRILAQKGEDLSAHRVITNLSLAEGFSADFVLKNGAMHVIETVDASSPGTSPRKALSDIAISALTIEQARIKFGDDDTRGRLVYQASAETEAAANSALTAAEHQGIELINWGSEADQRRLLAAIAALAEPLPTKSRNAISVHASMQHHLSLH